MSKTKRIQLKHTKGWKLPMNTVSVSGFSKWANPYKAPKDGSRMEVVELYRKMLLTYPQPSQGFLETDSYIHTLKQELGGKDLACWCPLDVPCHADVLLELARELKGNDMNIPPEDAILFNSAQHSLEAPIQPQSKAKKREKYHDTTNRCSKILV